MSISIVSSDEHNILADIGAGVSLNHAVQSAIVLATSRQKTVGFDFNGIRLEVDATSNVEERITYFQLEAARRNEAYVASDEYKAILEERRKEVAEIQVKIDVLMEGLPAIADNQEALILWLQQFASINDNRSLVFSKDAIIDELKRQGYEPNKWVGQPGITDDKVLSAEYIVGQALDHLMHGMPIHPMVGIYAEKYLSKFSS